MRALVIAAALLVAACQDSDNSRTGPLHRAVSDGVSFAKLDGWTLERTRDAWVQTDQASRHTIIVRSISRDGWSEDRNPESVLPATETWLRSLPKAEVKGPTTFEHPAYRADAFELSFVPSGKRGQLYQRRHVVVFADDHILHVLHTGPEGELASSQKQFDKVVKSVREES